MNPRFPLLAATIACRSVYARRQLPSSAAFMGCCIPHHPNTSPCSSRNRMDSTTSKKGINLLVDPSDGAVAAPSRSSSTSTTLSNIRKRRRLIAELAFSTPAIQQPADDGADHQAAKRNSDHQQRRRPRKKKAYRPGFNSYLKVLLDESTLQLLRQTTLDVQKMFHDDESDDDKNAEKDEADNVTQQQQPQQQQARSSSLPNDVETGEDAHLVDAAEKNSRPPPPLRIKPRSLNSLHMTLFFGGEVLCELSQEELTDWHGQVEKRIQQSFPSSNNKKKVNDNAVLVGNDSSVVDDSDDGGGDGDDDDDYWFRLGGLCLFPPRRNNLVVASLEASPAWHALHNDIRAIAAESASEQLRNLFAADSHGEWKPHITLANLRSHGPRRSQKVEQERLRELLDQVDLSTVPKLKASGISMGGPIPEHAPLNWNFPTT